MFTTSEMTLPFTDLQVNVRFVYTQAVPGRQYMANGNPGYPDEPAECELISVTTIEGLDLTQALSQECLDRLEEMIIEDSATCDYDCPSDD